MHQDIPGYKQVENPWKKPSCLTRLNPNLAVINWVIQLFVHTGGWALGPPSGHSWHSCLRSIGHYSSLHLPAAGERKAQAARDKARLAVNAPRGLRAQLATAGYPSERWSTGTTSWGRAARYRGELQRLHLHLGETRRRSGARFTRRRRKMKKRERLWSKKRKRHESQQRSCQQLNGALAWKHLQHMQVEQIRHPSVRKMKKTTVNLHQLEAVGRYLYHRLHRG